jgi:SAM-dependent methyltransferase
MSTASPQQDLVRHYEACFLEHGRTPKGVDWPNQDDLNTRFEVMLGVVRPGHEQPALLDLGCGPGLLLDYLERTGRRQDFDYIGVDLCEPMLESARRLWPDYRFARQDIVAQPLPGGLVDYVILNGVLTERRGASHAQMADYAVNLLDAAFRTARVGIAFNVMSKLVDWERDDLFHWGFDDMTAAVSRRLSRHIRIRADYGLYEYTVYVYRQAQV